MILQSFTYASSINILWCPKDTYRLVNIAILYPEGNFFHLFELVDTINMAEIDVTPIVDAIRAASNKQVFTPLLKSDVQSYEAFIKQAKLHKVLQDWNDADAKRKVLANLQQQAAYLADDLITPAGHNGENGDPNVTFEEFLTLLDKKFFPQGNQHALQNLSEAKQRAEETLAGWHTRCKGLYKRANPTHDANDRNLIQKFIMGIALPQVRLNTDTRCPDTYDSALEYSGQVYSALARNGQLDQPAVLAMQQAGTPSKPANPGARAQGPMTCYLCQRPGHAWRNCNTIKRLRNLMAQSNNNNNNNNRQRQQLDKNRNNPRRVQEIDETPEADNPRQPDEATTDDNPDDIDGQDLDAMDKLVVQDLCSFLGLD